MFDFDNDGNFDLDDIIQADIECGFFSKIESPKCGKFIENNNIRICRFCGHRFK